MEPRSDRETVRKGEMLRSLVESDGWKVAKAMLDEAVDEIKFVTTLDLKQNIEEIGKDAYSRAAAIRLVQAWFNRIQQEIDMYYEHITPQEDEEDDIIKQV